MAKRAFIVHGWEADSQSNWFPWLRKELLAHGFSVGVPDIPDTENPKMDEWVETLAEEVGKPDNDCYFIGHSLGCITILRYLETLKQGEKAGGAVLVAAFVESIGYKELDGFYKKPLMYDRISSCCKKFICMYSDDDPYVPPRYGDVLRKKLGAKILIEHGMSHFVEGDGTFRLPTALEAVLKMSK